MSAPRLHHHHHHHHHHRDDAGDDDDDDDDDGDGDDTWHDQRGTWCAPQLSGSTPHEALLPSVEEPCNKYLQSYIQHAVCNM